MRIVSVSLLLLITAAPAFAQQFSSKGLVGVASIPARTRDSQGETLGGFGSGMALVPGSWKREGGHFRATLAMLPDRGWNTEGTMDYRARLQFFDLDLAPGSPTPFSLIYRRTLLLADAAGAPTTGLDPDGFRPAGGSFPDLPMAANSHVSMDGEAMAMPGDGGTWVSEEYGPYIYHFDTAGRMTAAIRPPEAIIPMRDGRQNFSAGETSKGQPQSGRQNNQGFEGMSVAGSHLFAMTQSALIQDLDPADPRQTRRNVRLLDYDLDGKLAHEYVVQLPLYQDDDGAGVAAQSEMLALNDHLLLVLCSANGGGFTRKRAASAYRVVNIIDLEGASDIRGRFDGSGESIAPGGVLRSDIRPARMTQLLDVNDNSQLNRFGLHNGPPNDASNLYEKWESMALAPAKDPNAPDDYFLFIGSDNDFITQDGMMAGKPYKDATGADVDSRVLAYRVSLPGLGKIQ